MKKYFITLPPMKNRMKQPVEMDSVWNLFKAMRSLIDEAENYSKGVITSVGEIIRKAEQSHDPILGTYQVTFTEDLLNELKAIKNPSVT